MKDKNTEIVIIDLELIEKLMFQSEIKKIETYKNEEELIDTMIAIAKQDDLMD